MALITLTSDLGTRDFYVGALKGAIVTQCETFVPTIDITHNIKPFDIKEAAFTVRNAYKYFPKGTIHVVHVNSGDARNKMLLSVVDGHYFLTFDNGFLSIAFERTPHETYEINDELLNDSSLLFETAIGKVINLLLQEYKPTDFAHLTTGTTNFRLIQPVTSMGTIRGMVTNIDNYGNATTNITQAMFTRFIGDRKFTVFVNVGNTKTISRNYFDVEEGEMVCLFNTAQCLEVAINKGKAEKLLGLKLESPVLVIAD